MLIYFFDNEAIEHKEFIPPGRTVNRNLYWDVLKRRRENIQCKHPNRWWNDSWTLHPPHVPAHVSLVVRQCVAPTNMTTIPHPPYSLDPASSPCSGSCVSCCAAVCGSHKHNNHSPPSLLTGPCILTMFRLMCLLLCGSVWLPRTWQPLQTLPTHWTLHPHHVPAHVSLVVRQCVAPTNMTTIPHPPYSLDPAPVIFSYSQKWNWSSRGDTLTALKRSRPNSRMWWRWWSEMTSNRASDHGNPAGSLYQCWRGLLQRGWRWI
jgi:hypothetical protein